MTEVHVTIPAAAVIDLQIGDESPIVGDYSPVTIELDMEKLFELEPLLASSIISTQSVNMREALLTINEAVHDNDYTLLLKTLQEIIPRIT